MYLRELVYQRKQIVGGMSVTILMFGKQKKAKRVAETLIQLNKLIR
jgi:hypothetical protein